MIEWQLTRLSSKLLDDDAVLGRGADLAEAEVFAVTLEPPLPVLVEGHKSAETAVLVSGFFTLAVPVLAACFVLGASGI
ncbi:MAG: hypothetical protein CVU22_06980 [Betaproteobacteria bacterium HGW-Betaproteobacteria-16]|nr:MAG: hypothetical protein CVU22_06980 [Betaproteobacteria bacterium HGW-Betaproteobacteria-16]